MRGKCFKKIIAWFSCLSSRRDEPAIHIKKPCPLEMSIKAANLDTEFENESYLELQPSLTTYGLMPGESVQPIVLGPQKPIMGLQPAPLQVLLVQFQPQGLWWIAEFFT